MDLEMVSYLSKLGKLSFNDEELAKMAKEMKFLPKAAKINICYEIAKDCGVLKEN